MQRWLVVRFGRFPVSFRIRARVPLILLMLALLILAGLVLNVGVGELRISPLAVIETLLGNGTREQTFIVMRLRLPRALVAILVGVGMAVAGAILQGLTRNPLASPDIIGVSSGASLVAVTIIILVRAAPASILPIVALAGACASAFLVYWLAWRGGVSPTRLILVGIGLSAVSTALVHIMIAASDLLRVNQALIWLIGSVYGRTWEHLYALLPWIAIFVPLAFFLARQLDALHLGDDLARGLGSNVEWQRLVLLAASVALAGSSVATAGAVAFVGLMAPHMARLLVGPAHGGLLPTTALIGGLTVLLADLVGRTIFAPIEIPCGVITAAIGAPYFIWLLIRSRSL